MGGALDCNQFRSPKAAAEQLELLYAGLPADRCHNTVTPASSGGNLPALERDLVITKRILRWRSSCGIQRG